MSEKVKLPHEVAEAINAARECGHTNERIIQFSFIQEENSDHRNNLRDFARDNFDILLSALVNGFEVEETPEDKIANWYKDLKRQIDNGINGDYKEKIIIEQTTITDVLRILGIKIEGVNA